MLTGATRRFAYVAHHQLFQRFVVGGEPLARMRRPLALTDALDQQEMHRVDSVAEGKVSTTQLPSKVTVFGRYL